MQNAQAIYQAMVEESDRHSMPTTFKTDMTIHDYGFVHMYPEASFAWYLYPQGTHIVRKVPPRTISDMYAIEKIMDTITNDFRGGHWYLCDGSKLKPSNAGAVRAWLKGSAEG